MPNKNAPQPPSQVSLLTLLKNKTLGAHTSIERTINLPLRMKDLAAYRSLLELFFGFFDPMEARLRAAPGILAIFPDLESRMRSRLLERDLAELGLPAAVIRDLPRCRKLLPLPAAAQAIGCLYVLEGSTLGGQIIARGLSALGEQGARASLFFLSGAEDVGWRWKRFGAAAEAFAAQNPDGVRLILTAAEQTFQCLDDWIAHAEIGRSANG